MNRLVLIGNGFDLAHGLKTSYADFINWYKAHRIEQLGKVHTNVSQDPLCTIKLLEPQALSIYASNYIWANQNISHVEFFDYIVGNTLEFETKFSPFFERIIKSIETKGWVDIENEYYELLTGCAFDSVMSEAGKLALIKPLNNQLDYLKEQLVLYLQEVSTQESNKIISIENAITAPFNAEDIALSGEEDLQEHIVDRISFFRALMLTRNIMPFGRITFDGLITSLKKKLVLIHPQKAMSPRRILLLNFNYTHTAKLYHTDNNLLVENHIHGDIDDSKSVIFGYGDEIDDFFKKLQKIQNGEVLRYVKSIRYLEAPNYRNVLSFIESAPFQVLIMGHSCGNSDRTLLNTIFEHKNCVSIKPYYYVKEDGTDNYIELVQNISRNFTDMKLMRDRVVNKTQCEPLVRE